ncbi:hypothetical protein E3A20_17460, partial [Planctomyces bekefii]
MKHVVGIDRRIRRQWLDAVLDRLAVTRDEAELRGYLDQQLQAELPSGASRRKSSSTQRQQCRQTAFLDADG